jgi:nitrogen fixation protein NifB
MDTPHLPNRPALEEHPCFNKDARQRTARIHLPVAAACNLQCNYCNRKYSCVNESRPGVTAAVLEPEQAVDYLQWARSQDPRIKVVGIAGPGDPFAANGKATMKTIGLISERHSDLLLCLATNGLGLLEHIPALEKANVSHVTLTVNAIDPRVGAEIYAWARFKKRMHRGQEAAALLWERQKASISALRAAGIVVKINTLMIPGINDEHVAEVAREVAALGANVQNCIPIYPVEGSAWEHLTPPSASESAAIRKRAEAHIPQMSHCTRCRADAVGLLGADMPKAFFDKLQSRMKQKKQARPNIAVASREGMLVNQHLGEARELLIYGPPDGGKPAGFEVLERRRTPAVGQGDARWQELGELLSDCQALLVGGVGNKPKRILASAGIEIYDTEGLIARALEALYAGQKPDRSRPKKMACGVGCGGDRAGCG